MNYKSFVGFRHCHRGSADPLELRDRVSGQLDIEHVTLSAGRNLSQFEACLQIKRIAGAIHLVRRSRRDGKLRQAAWRREPYDGSVSRRRWKSAVVRRPGHTCYPQSDLSRALFHYRATAIGTLPQGRRLRHGRPGLFRIPDQLQAILFSMAYSLPLAIGTEASGASISSSSRAISPEAGTAA